MQIVVSVTAPAVEVQIGLIDAFCVQCAKLGCTLVKRRKVVVLLRSTFRIVMRFPVDVNGNAGMHDWRTDQIGDVRIAGDFLTKRNKAADFF